MHEKEKMMTSRAYLASDPQLRAERQHAKEVYYDYNTHFQAEPERCHQRLAQLLCTEHPFYIEAPFRCDYGYNLRIGKGCFCKSPTCACSTSLKVALTTH